MLHNLLQNNISTSSNFRFTYIIFGDFFFTMMEKKEHELHFWIFV